MSRIEKDYEKLPGQGRPPFPRGFVGGGNTRLYLAKDHILKVETTYCLERYRRFYLSDIQLVRIARNSRAFWTSIVLGLFLILCALPVVFWNELPAQITFGIISAVLLIFLLVNLVIGPSCTTRIETSIGGEEIHSLTRLRKARKVVGRLILLIHEAQGGGDSTQLAQRLREEQPPPLSFVDLWAQRAAASSFPENPGRAWLGTTTGVSLVAHSMASGLLLAFPSTWGLPLGIGLIVIALFFDVLILARPLRGVGRKLAGTIFGWICVYAGALYALMIASAITGKEPSLVGDEVEMYATFFREGANQSGIVVTLLSISVAVSGVLGLTVLLQMLRARTR